MVQHAADVLSGPGRLDQIDVQFNEPRLISDAGLLLTATLADRLGLEGLVNGSVWLGYGTPGAALPGRKVMTLVHGMIAGADCIDDMNVLRAGSTQAVLGHQVMAPSTLGTFLRAFSFGHVRQLDHVLDQAISRAWQAGAGPGDGPLVIDLDSFVGEVYGYEKQGAGYGYTHRYGYHPLLATRADTGEVLHIRFRKGSANTQRGIERFVDELLARVRRAGHQGQVVLRADSGFENHKLMTSLAKRGMLFSIGAKQSKTARELIAQIPETAWQRVSDYSERGEAQVAEVPYKNWRLIVRRTRLKDPEQLALWPDWRHHAFLTNQSSPVLDADSDHRDHAQIEQVISDLKAQALAHFPSGIFNANSAWTVIAALAHNLGRWTTLIGDPDASIQTAASRRRQLFQIPGRIVSSARRFTLRLPARWPWQSTFLSTLTRIRALPAPS
ncbi:MAG TPA: IS1380 family transposase [Solirubrobacteraceae bacterium]|nr:IS1380 family transposase [Solirubrobacteraceae bacterium]